MHSALLDRVVEELHAVRRHVSFSSRMRDLAGESFSACTSEGIKCPDLAKLFAGAPDATSWRILDHCTVVTRAYALFEGYVFEILREHINFLSNSYRFAELGEDFSGRYSKGIGQILLDQDKQRYAKIDIPTLLAEATAALSNQHPYQLRPEALLRAEQNLRMPELQRLVSQCGMSGIESWVSRHGSVRSFFASQSRLSDTASSELKQIVDYRNEAAHGGVDQVLGSEVLTEVTEFFEALLMSVTDFIQYDTLARVKALGKAQVVGWISEQFHDDIVVAKITQSTLRVGDTLYVYGKGITGIAEIKSIEIDDVAQEAVTITSEREVGLRLGMRAKEGCELLRLS